MKTVTEKYHAVKEGRLNKKEFVRQMRLEHPQHITQFNGFDDSVQILKNRGLLFEKKVEAVEEAKVYDDRPALTYSLDALDRGIRVELATLGVEPGQQSIKAEDLKKATKKAKDNLEKNPTHYLDLMSGESNKVDKQDKMKETKRGAKDTDVMNSLKKATLKEGYTEEQIEAAIQRIKERKAGEHPDGTPKSNDEMGDDERENFYNDLDSVDEVEKSEEEKDFLDLRDRALVGAGIGLTTSGVTTHEIVFDHNGKTKTIAFRDSEEAAEQAKVKLEKTGLFADKNLRVVPAGMKEDSVDESEEPVMVDGEELPFEDAVYDLIELTGDLISREMEHEEWLDFIEMHEPHLLRKDILDAAAKQWPDDINPFIEYLDGIGYELGLNEKDGYNTDPTLQMHIDDEEWERENGRGPKKDVVKEAGRTALIQTMNNAISAIKGKYGKMPGIAGIIRDFLMTHLDDLANGADPLDEFENYVNVNYDSLSENEETDYSVELLVPSVAYDVESGELADSPHAFATEDEIESGEADVTTYTDGEELDAWVFSNDYDQAMNFAKRYPDLIKINSGTSVAEKKGKDHDGDGDIDGDDYMAAKDKAIKGAMGKKVDEIGMFHDPIGYDSNAAAEDKRALELIKSLIEKGVDRDTAIEKAGEEFKLRTSYLQKKMNADSQIKEAVKTLIRKALTEEALNEAATGNLSKFSDDYADFAGMTQIINQLENLVTEVEGFYAKTGEKLQKIFDSIGNVTNEEGLKVGGFIAPAIESAFKKDIQPVVKKGFMNSVQIPTIKQISQADIDAHNSGVSPLGEEEMEEKQTMFTPVMESKKK